MFDTDLVSSFVGMYPIPTVHGLTVGELAQMIVGEKWLDGLEAMDLQVVGMEGWRRNMQWPYTGIEWIAPSPNLATFEAALHYPGTCLFEGTILSEGRGAECPFEQFGAPWLDAEAVAAATEAEVRGRRFRR